MFKVHDTVRCIDASCSELDIFKIYTVLDVQSPYGFLGIEIEVDGVLRYYSPSRFEVVTSGELPKFDGNTKDDGNKLMGYSGVDRYFPRVLDLLANLSQGGAEKYDWDGWASVEDGVIRYRNAEWRHRQAIAKGEDIDEDISRYAPFPVRHEVSRIWNLMAALELELRDEDE